MDSVPSLSIFDFSPAAPWYESPEHGVVGLRAYSLIKRLVDIIVCLLAVVTVAPVLALICIAIKMDSPGPAFYYQRRTGRGGRRFKMWKLRTMVHNADEMKQGLAHLNQLNYPDFKIFHDPRVTRIGRILRKLSLDELPQLFNVLVGNMSLVGPRPTSFTSETYQLWHTERLEAKPGITGLWQVSGRNKLDFDDRLRLDIAYVRNRSLLLDFQILLRTLKPVLTQEGAH